MRPARPRPGGTGTPAVGLGGGEGGWEPLRGAARPHPASPSSPCPEGTPLRPAAPGRPAAFSNLLPSAAGEEAEPPPRSRGCSAERPPQPVPYLK